MDWENKKVVITGGAGFLGTHLTEQLRAKRCKPIIIRSSDFNLTFEADIDSMFQSHPSIDLLIHLAARVGGIGLNEAQPGYLFYTNAIMGINLIEYARIYGVKKVVIVGTVCAYPRSEYVLCEGALWAGYPDPTNAPYGLAKKMLLVQLQAYEKQYGFKSCYILPTNLYGPLDNFDLETSHVIPALIKKMVEAQVKGNPSVTVWGSGEPLRDFLYVDDAARGLVLVAEKLERPEPINLGSGDAISIMALADLIQRKVGYEGRIEWDLSRPDGQPRRVLDISLARRVLGWEPRVGLQEGLERTIAWYRETYCNDVRVKNATLTRDSSPALAPCERLNEEYYRGP